MKNTFQKQKITNYFFFTVLSVGFATTSVQTAAALQCYDISFQTLRKETASAALVDSELSLYQKYNSDYSNAIRQIKTIDWDILIQKDSEQASNKLFEANNIIQNAYLLPGRLKKQDLNRPAKPGFFTEKNSSAYLNATSVFIEDLGHAMDFKKIQENIASIPTFLDENISNMSIHDRQLSILLTNLRSLNRIDPYSRIFPIKYKIATTAEQKAQLQMQTKTIFQKAKMSFEKIFHTTGFNNLTEFKALAEQGLRI